MANTVISLDGVWQLATDPANIGRDANWPITPHAAAQSVHVPSIIQEYFPAYHGVVWYWRRITPPANPHPGGRALLRFGAVDYMADVWVNGAHVGGHEGGETPFTLDITDALRIHAAALIAVRVLNPTVEHVQHFGESWSTSGSGRADGESAINLKDSIERPDLSGNPDKANLTGGACGTELNASHHAPPVRFRVLTFDERSGRHVVKNSPRA